MDIAPLVESAPFRWLYFGQFLAFVGRQLTVVAVPYQIYLLTGSTLAVGALGLAQFIPMMLASIFGGPLIDAMDRRKVLVISQLPLAATALGLAFNASLDAPLVWPLFALSAVNAGLSAIDGPAPVAAIPSLLSKRLLVSGFALNQTMSQVQLVSDRH
jgi:MFS family permease